MKQESRIFRLNPLAVAIAAMALNSAPVAAQVTVTTYLDGAMTGGANQTGSVDCTTDPDWTTLFNSAGATIELCGGLAATLGIDDIALKGATDRTVFASSNKNNDPIPTWQWNTGNTPAKDDQSIGMVYATKNASNQLLIFGGIERIANEGDSHVDIEFNQSGASLDKMPECLDDGTAGAGDGPPCEFVGNREDGDLIVSMDFVKGGGIGTVTIYRWDAALGSYQPLTTLTGEGCDAGTTACAFNNGTDIVGGPWPHVTKSGTATLPPNAFTEFGVNVDALIGNSGGASPCFASVNFKTRTSQSFTSELKDFAVFPFEECTTSTTTEVRVKPSDTVIANDAEPPLVGSVPVYSTVYDTATVAGIEGLPPTGNVIFTRYDNGTCAGAGISTETVALSGAGATRTATSSDWQVTAAGMYGYTAEYQGDSNYPSSASGCEAFNVTPVDSSVSTKVLRGGTNVTNTALDLADPAIQVQDEATVMGSISGVDPTGTVTFRKYASADCTGTYVDDGPISLAAGTPNDGKATALSNVVTLDTEGFFCWQAFYSGDSVYKPSSHMIGEPICVFEFNPTIP